MQARREAQARQRAALRNGAAAKKMSGCECKPGRAQPSRMSNAEPVRPAAPDLEKIERTCPNCGARLKEHKCELKCPNCSYFKSCSDY